MDIQTIVAEANKILDDSVTQNLLFRGTEFLRLHAGEKSTFYQSIKAITDKYLKHPWGSGHDKYNLAEINSAKSAIQGFIDFLQAGQIEGISVVRQAQIDVVSDYLEQAQLMLEDQQIHPAVPTVLIGASLEEFLRNWIEEKNLDGGIRKPGIDSYAKILRQEELITKQDAKDITSWGGLRNSAAHGNFDEIKVENARLMLQGVNLFMRTYTSQ